MFDDAKHVRVKMASPSFLYSLWSEHFILWKQSALFHSPVSGSHMHHLTDRPALTWPRTWTSPGTEDGGCRGLAGLWESRCCPADGVEKNSGVNPTLTRVTSVHQRSSTHPVIFGFVWSTAVSDGGLCPLELSRQQLPTHEKHKKK